MINNLMLSKFENRLPIIFLFVALICPLVILLSNNLSLVGMAEESVGYRYFYSLRILYGDGEHLFLPQGHLLSVFHFVIQILLTKFGFRIDNFGSRIEIFTYLSCFVPLLISTAAFVWSVRPIHNLFVKFLAVFAIITTIFHLRNGGGFHLVIPDYYIWSLPFSLIFFGLSVREINSPGYLVKRWLFLGLYTGLCFTMKITYLVMPIALALMCSLRPPTYYYIISSVKATIVATFTAVSVLLIYYKGDVSGVMYHFDISSYKQYSATLTNSFWQWLKLIILARPYDNTSFVALLPLTLLVMLVFTKNFRVFLGLLTSWMMLAFVTYHRPYPPTLVEFSTIGVVFGLVALYCLYKKYPEFFNISYFKCSKLILITLLILMLLICCNSINMFFVNFFQQYKKSTSAQMELSKYLTEVHGKTIFIIVNNQYRPTTIDSAIFKGAMQINDNMWPKDGFLINLTADRSYIVQDNNIHINAMSFEKLVFVATYGFELQQEENISKLYNVDFSKYKCDFTADLGVGGINWFLPYVKSNLMVDSGFFPDDGAMPRVLVACKKRG